MTQRTHEQRSPSGADLGAVSDGVARPRRRCPHCSVVIVGDDLDLALHADDFAEFVDFAAVTCAVCGGRFLWPAPPRLLLREDGEEKQKKKKMKMERQPRQADLRFLGLLGPVAGIALSLGLCGLATVVAIPFAFVVGGIVLFSVCGVYACVRVFKTFA